MSVRCIFICKKCGKKVQEKKGKKIKCCGKNMTVMCTIPNPSILEEHHEMEND